MKRILLFTLSFTAITLVLTWLWLSGGNAYYGVTLLPVAREINEWLGLDGPGTMYRHRFINVVPFVSLMLVTPRIPFRRRIGGLTIGLLVLVASHLALNAMAVGLGANRKLSPTASLVSDAEPFILWFVIARDFIQEAVRGVRTSNTRSSDTDPLSSNDARPEA